METNKIRENRWKSWVFFRFLAMERMIRIFENISQRKGGKKERYRHLSMVPQDGMRTSWRFNNVAVDRLDIKKI